MTKEKEIGLIQQMSTIEGFVDKQLGLNVSSVNEIFSVVPNNRTRVFHVVTPDKDALAKIYIKKEDAETEIANYYLLQGLDFIPRLLAHNLGDANTGGGTFIIFAFIRGETLHSLFTRRKMDGTPANLNYVTEVMDQIGYMDKQVAGQKVRVLKTHTPIFLPVREGFFSETEKSKFLFDYALTSTRNLEACNLLRGFYFDRNPRNIIITAGQITQVDFGSIHFSSPLFDIAKLVRNGVDIPLKGDHLNDQNPYDLNTFTESQEAELRRLAYQKLVQEKKIIIDEHYFNLLLNHAFLTTHIFYLTKYKKYLNDGIGHDETLRTRIAYHYKMGMHTIYDLKQDNEKVQGLEGWMNYFLFK